MQNICDPFCDSAAEVGITVWPSFFWPSAKGKVPCVIYQGNGFVEILSSLLTRFKSCFPLVLYRIRSVYPVSNTLSAARMGRDWKVNCLDTYVCTPSIYIFTHTMNYTTALLLNSDRKRRVGTAIGLYDGPDCTSAFPAKRPRARLHIK